MSQKPINQQNILITGGTSGLGLELVKLFLKKGYNVVATGRQFLNMPGFGDQFKFFQVDFSDMNQVAFITKNICEIYAFDYVINNAGVLSPPDSTPANSGFEYTVQVNYLSHLIINEIILKEVKNDNPLKIVAVTSPVYKLADKDLLIQSDENGYSSVKAYSNSKLYLTLMCEFLPVKYPGVNLQCFSFDPGTFRSGIYRMQRKWFKGLYRVASPFMRSPVKVAAVLAEILLDETVGNGMIIDIRKHCRPVPLKYEDRKTAFLKRSYDAIDPFIKKINRMKLAETD